MSFQALVVLLVWGPHSEQHGLGGVTISASPRGCPVARNPALHLLGSLYSLPAAFLRSKISIGLVHSFRHSQSTALPGQALQRRPSGQHLTLEGSQSTRKGWGGLLSGEPGGGGGGKGNTAPAPPAGLREGPLGHRHALVPRRPSKRPGCISSPARCCMFHTETQTPAVDVTERSHPGYPCWQAPRPTAPLCGCTATVQTNMLEIQPPGPSLRLLQHRRVWNRTLAPQWPGQVGRTQTPGQLPMFKSQPQRSQTVNRGLSFPICQRGMIRVLALQSYEVVILSTNI